MDSLQVVLTLAALALAILAVTRYEAERPRPPYRSSAAGENGGRAAPAITSPGPPPADARLADASHELRTPLAGMIGMAGLLLDTRLTPEQASYAEAIRASGQALLAVIDDFLDAAADTAGAAAAPQSFSPQAMVEQVVELLAPRAADKGIEIAGFADPALPPRLLGDAGKLRQVLFNLAGNAVKYTAAGGVGVRIDRVRGGVAFAVHDTGPGIPEEVRARLFAPFQRGAELEGGAGLGLSIVARLAARLGGALAVDSAPGRGTSIVLTVPLATGDAAAAAPPTDLAGLDVVVAARSPFAAPWLVEALAAAGARAELAADAAGAATLLAARRRDVLIADRALDPEICRIAAAARAGGCRTVALASPAERRDLAGLHAAGFDHFLVKPVRAASLLGVLGAPARLPTPPAAAPSPYMGAGRALLAEDDEVNALLARAQLERLGFAVEHVRDGAAAVAAAAAAFDAGLRFDLVVLDLRLPRLDGAAAAREIRTAEAARGAPRAAVLAISAHARAAECAAAAAAGIDAVLDKPLDRAALTAALAPRAAVAG